MTRRADPPSEESDDAGFWWTSRAAPVLIVAVAIGLIGAIVLVSRQEQDSGLQALAATTVETAALPVVVPYREVAGYLVIDVTLGDSSRTVPMILDTGAPTIVSEEVAEAFGSGSAGTISTSSVDGQVFTSEVATLPRLSIGEATFTDVGAVVGAIEPGNPFYCVTQTGFIGASLMQTGAWRIDPRTGTVTIAATAAEITDLDDAVRLDFARASDVSPSPLVELPVGQGTLPVLLDTGSDGWLAVSPGELDSVGGVLHPDAPARDLLASTFGGLVRSHVTWSSTDIGLGLAGPVPIAAIDTLPDGQGNAGGDLLRHFVLTLDWSEDAAYLQPLDDTPVPSAPPSSSVAWDDGFVVGSRVLGQAGRDGPEVGIPVTAIAGRDVSRASFDDFCRHMREGPSTYEMTVSGDPPTTVMVAPVEDFHQRLGD
jgi:predicted aspartyl protease